MCYQLAGRYQWHEAKSFSGPATGRPNMFHCLQQSGCGSKLSPQKPWFDNPEESTTGSKADSHLVIVTVSQEAKLINFDIVNPL